MAELLEGFRQGPGNWSCDRVAIEVLAAEHPADAELVGDELVALEGIVALPRARRTRPVVADACVIEHDIWAIRHWEIFKDLLSYRADAIRTDDIQYSVAHQRLSV